MEKALRARAEEMRLIALVLCLAAASGCEGLLVDNYHALLAVLDDVKAER